MQLNLFAFDIRLEELTELGDCFFKLNMVDWESLRTALEKAFPKERKSNDGRHSYDVMKFKIFVLQHLFNLSDEQTEFQMNDHKGFIRFLGLFPGNKVPDAKTIWLYCEYMTKADVIEQQFIDNCIELWSNGIITHTGTIIDVTFVDALCHRNSREENQTFIQQNIHSIFTFFYARYICFVVIRKDINADIIVFLGISPLFFEKSTLRFPD